MAASHPPPTAVPAASAGLVRAVSRWTLVAVMVNAIVGGGIFGLPSQVHALAGPFGLLAFVACGFVVASFALCFAEVSSRFTETGGPYLYAARAFGPVAGFLVGWLMWITRLTSVAAVANVMISYLAQFWPAAGAGPARTLATCVAVLLLTSINLLGVRQAAGTATAFTLAKLSALVLFVVVGVFFLDLHRFVAGAVPAAAPFSQAVLLIVFAFGGFEGVVVLAGEAKDPRRDLPFTLFVALGAITLLYLLIQTVCIGTLPALATSTKPLADASALFMGATGATIVTLGALFSTGGTMFSSLLLGPRVLYAMAEQHQVPRVLGWTHPTTRTPTVAIVLTGLGALALAVSGTFKQLASLSVITRLLIYVATAGALLVLRRRDQEYPAHYRAPAGVLVAFVAIAACVWLMITSALSDLRNVGIAMLVGLALFAATRAGRRRTRPVA